MKFVHADWKKLDKATASRVGHPLSSLERKSRLTVNRPDTIMEIDRWWWRSVRKGAPAAA